MRLNKLKALFQILRLNRAVKKPAISCLKSTVLMMYNGNNYFASTYSQHIMDQLDVAEPTDDED